jgi:vacuolar-type H+-ATPase subunit C/Vma6
MDFLSARLHGRRSLMAEAERLDALCRIRSLPELGRALYGDAALLTAVDLQRRMVREHAEELVQIARAVDGPAARLIEGLCLRFQVENLKVLARGFATRTPWSQVQTYLVPLEGDLAVNGPAFVAAETLDAFAGLIPEAACRESVREILPLYQALPRSFFIEAALDRGYFTQLLGRAAALPEADRVEVLTIIRQEIATFHMMLVARGKFQYGLKPEQLLSFGIKGAAKEGLASLLAVPDLATAVARLVGRAIDKPAGASPSGRGVSESTDPAVLEVLAWNRFYRTANWVFRRSHMGLAAVVAYAAIRRVELANLITLTEGIRANVPPEALRRRLIPRTDLADLPDRTPETARV